MKNLRITACATAHRIQQPTCPRICLLGSPILAGIHGENRTYVRVGPDDAQCSGTRFSLDFRSQKGMHRRSYTHAKETHADGGWIKDTVTSCETACVKNSPVLFSSLLFFHSLLFLAIFFHACRHESIIRSFEKRLDELRKGKGCWMFMLEIGKQIGNVQRF